MDLLRTITLVYAGVLVLALAVSLTIVIVYLRRIGSKLAAISAALAVVERRTQPIADRLEAVDREVARIERAGLDVSAHFSSTAAVLDTKGNVSKNP